MQFIYLTKIFTGSSFQSFGILNSNLKDVQEYVEAIKILDVAIMIGSGSEECDFITDFTQKVHDYIGKWIYSTTVKS